MTKVSEVISISVLGKIMYIHKITLREMWAEERTLGDMNIFP